MVKDVTPEYVEETMKKTKLLFVDCWAAWCGPCRALSPILEELEQKYSNSPDIGFLKVNTDEHQVYAIKNHIMGIPCVLIFFNGEAAKLKITNKDTGVTTIHDRLIGLRPAEHFEYVIESLLGGNQESS
ncbi:MAG: thioredoxin family protein [Candidatus Odinarchaeota archaeon]